MRWQAEGQTEGRQAFLNRSLYKISKLPTSLRFGRDKKLVFSLILCWSNWWSWNPLRPLVDTISWGHFQRSIVYLASCFNIKVIPPFDHEACILKVLIVTIFLSPLLVVKRVSTLIGQFFVSPARNDFTIFKWKKTPQTFNTYNLCLKKR